MLQHLPSFTNSQWNNMKAKAVKVTEWLEGKPALVSQVFASKLKPRNLYLLSNSRSHQIGRYSGQILNKRKRIINESITFYKIAILPFKKGSDNIKDTSRDCQTYQQFVTECSKQRQPCVHYHLWIQVGIYVS